MGLDIVELIMAVEEDFGIELPDDEAVNLVTPALLTEYVLTRVELAGQSVCLSRKAFYALRRVLMKEFGCPRVLVKPDTPLEALVPRLNRRDVWRRMQAALQAKRWPGLIRPRWMPVILFTVFAGVMVTLLFLGYRIIQSCFSGLLVGLAGLLATMPWRTEFPEHCRTVGELARKLIILAPAVVAHRTWTREEVAETIRQLTIQLLGLKPEQYRPDARFVQDLGAD